MGAKTDSRPERFAVGAPVALTRGPRGRGLWRHTRGSARAQHCGTLMNQGNPHESLSRYV
jgi:hypothetical protein